MADESCAGPVIRALRTAGHDVIAIAEIAKGTSDERVMERAFRAGRVLLTEDADFGELVYARGRPSAGVIFVKFHSRARRAKPGAVVEAVAKLDERLRDGFAVIEPGRVRIAKRPQSRSSVLAGAVLRSEPVRRLDFNPTLMEVLGPLACSRRRRAARPRNVVLCVSSPRAVDQKL